MSRRERSRRVIWSASRGALALALATAGCGEGAGGGTADAGRCEPDAAAYESEVRPRIARYCGACHGERPDFGAPVSLVSLDAMRATRADGTRLVDRIAARVADGTMPPVGMPRLPDADANALVRWASCGQRSAPPTTGLVASAAPQLAPERGPAGLTPIELRARDFAVAPTARDLYQCFVFDADIPGDRFVRRFEMIYGDTRVLHHLVLSRDTDRRTNPGAFACNGGSGMPLGAQYLYVWAPGQAALEFPSGGLRVRPGERFIVQIHYNNGAGVEGVRDSSGVRMLLGPTEGTEYGMFSMGSMGFRLPPRQRTTVEGRCVIRRETTLFAGMPHMHRLGSTFVQTLTPAGGSPRELLSLRGWSFETQLFYAMPTTLRAGDEVRTACTFENTRADAVSFGEGTDDEMCNNFIYATPPPESPLCDEGGPAQPRDLSYTPGACLPPDASASVPLVQGRWTQAAEAPPLRTAPVPDGRWVLEGAEMFATGGATPLGALNLAASYLLAKGQVRIAGGQLTYDVALDTVVIVGAGMRFGMPDRQGFTVPFDGRSARVEATPTCPAGAPATSFAWGFEGDVLTLQFTRRELPGQTLWPTLRFRRAP